MIQSARTLKQSGIVVQTQNQSGRLNQTNHLIAQLIVQTMTHRLIHHQAVLNSGQNQTGCLFVQTMTVYQSGLLLRR